MLGDLFVYCEHVTWIVAGILIPFLEKRPFLLLERVAGQQLAEPEVVWRFPISEVDVDIQLTNALSPLTRF
jgi:hypothetical protein